MKTELHNTKLYKMKTLLLMIPWVVIIMMSCSHHADISVNTNEKSPILEYARSELENFLGEDILRQAAKADIRTIRFELVVQPELPESAFAVGSTLQDGKLSVNLFGRTPSDVLYAAYTFLEQGGYLFEITGPVYPEKFNWNKVKNYTEKVIPAVKQRGIRQHLNFPMDLSAWPLSDAKKYIGNLSRMRFNYITFHSYPGQWYEVTRNDTTEYAGHFFYGDVHLVPDDRHIKAIAVNKKYYCIPEIEPFFDDIPKRSRMAVEWLRGVIEEAKNTGMKVQFSFEPRNPDTAIDKTVETVKAILKEYPMIDALELITEEAGGWGPQTTREKTEKTVVDHFGKAYLKDEVVMQPVKEKQSDIAYIYAQTGHNIKVIKYLTDNQLVPEGLSLKLGIYVVIPDYARPAFYLARKSLPETEISLLSGHHSRNVRDNVPKVFKNREDWDHSIIYSWIEFDGMMFLQQNPVGSIRDIVAMAVENTSDHRANKILYNHWRTAENKVTARYAAVSGLYGATDPATFYRQYAAAYGIDDEEGFARAMQDLENADLASIDNIGGIGFCWMGRWRRGGPVSGYDIGKLKTTREAYQKVLDDLKQCARTITNNEAYNLIALLDNRVRTTIIYLKTFEKARRLATYHTEKTLSGKEKKTYVRICNESLAMLEQYIDVYAAMNADRGCSGNLVSLWYGPVKALKYLRRENGGIPFDDSVPQGTAVDAPPLPAVNPETSISFTD